MMLSDFVRDMGESHIIFCQVCENELLEVFFKDDSIADIPFKFQTLEILTQTENNKSNFFHFSFCKTCSVLYKFNAVIDYDKAPH